MIDEENNSGDEMTLLENMSSDDDEEVYKEIGNVSLVVLRTLTTQAKEEGLKHNEEISSMQGAKLWVELIVLL